MAKTYDVKCVLFTANEKGKTSHKSIDLESFIECLNKWFIECLNECLFVYNRVFK